MKKLLLTILLTGCSSLAWPVSDATTVQQLDEKYSEQSALVEADPLCVNGDPLRYSYYRDGECERLQLQVWGDYWRARRTLAELKGWK